MERSTSVSAFLAEPHRPRVRFLPLQSDLERLNALASSGKSGLARKAQAERQRLMTQQLMRETWG